MVRGEREQKRARLAAGATGTDRLSSLPVPVIHHVMSLLPLEDFTRMTALSSPILSLCRSFPFVDFDYSKFAENGDSLSGDRTFADHVRTSLERRVLTTDLERLSLVAPSFINVSEVVAYALENNVREMILKCPFDKSERIKKSVLPYSVFKSKSVKKLSLSGFHAERRYLTIKNPLMEELALTDSSASRSTVSISCPKLKMVKIYEFSDAAQIHIHDNTARSLESFSFSAKFYEARCEIVNLASCKSIKALELCHVNIEDSLFTSNALCLNSLESLSLKRCRVVSKLTLRSKRLERLELENCYGLASVELDAINLRRFNCTTSRLERELRECRIDFTRCPSMRELTLNGDVAVPTGILTLKFEFLEKLELSDCNNVETLIIKASHLLSFRLNSCFRLQELIIEAPNLLYFAYQGKILHTSPTCIVSTEFEATIRLIETLTADEKLSNFLSSFEHSKKLSLYFETEQPLIYNSELRSKMISPLHELRHLSINMDSKTAPIEDIVDSLLWLVPRPMMVSISVGCTMDLTLKFYYDFSEVSDGSEHQKHRTQCCTSSLFKCWKHNVMRVEIEGFSKFHEKKSLQSYLVCSADNAIAVSM